MYIGSVEKATASDGRGVVIRGGAVRTSFIERSLSSPVLGSRLVTFATGASSRAGALVYVLSGLCVQIEWESATRRLCKAWKAIT